MGETIEEFDEESSQPILVGYYGEHWEPDAVDWSALKASLRGTKSRNGKGGEVRVSDMRGVYVLFKDYVPVYTGKADKESIGARIKKHRLSPRTSKRWDTFSWFQIVDSLNDSDPSSESGTIQVTKSSVIATVEALLILVSAPKLNSRREKFKGATLLYQVQSDTTREEGIRGILERLRKIEHLLKSTHRTKRTKLPSASK